MKKIVVLMTALLTFTVIQAQESKAYLGVSIGVAIPGGDGAEYLGTGLNVGFLNFGYRFNKSWGATFNGNSSAFILNSNNNNSTIGIGSFSLGPMYTINVSKKLFFDLKPQYAFSSTAVLDIPNYRLTFKGTGFGLGGSLNFGISKGFKMSINSDYFRYKFNDTQVVVLGQTTSISYNNANQFIIGAGLKYNF